MMFFGRLQWAAMIVAAVGLALVIAYWRGWVGGVNHERGKWEVKWAEMHAQSVKQQHEWNAKANAFAKEVSDARDQIDAMSGKIRDLLSVRASRVRVAFTGDVTRMLNTLSPIRETVASAPGADAARPPVVADPSGPQDGSSEHAVAGAMLECRAGYVKCAAQVDGLQKYVREITR